MINTNKFTTQISSLVNLHYSVLFVYSEGNCLCLGNCPLEATIADGQERESEVYLHHKDGHRVPVFVRVSTLRDSFGNVIGGIELFTDISSILVNNQRLQELEKLTQLANRHYLERELRARFEKYKGEV